MRLRHLLTLMITLQINTASHATIPKGWTRLCSSLLKKVSSKVNVNSFKHYSKNFIYGTGKKSVGPLTKPLTGILITSRWFRNDPKPSPVTDPSSPQNCIKKFNDKGTYQELKKIFLHLKENPQARYYEEFFIVVAQHLSNESFYTSLLQNPTSSKNLLLFYRIIYTQMLATEDMNNVASLVKRLGDPLTHSSILRACASNSESYELYKEIINDIYKVFPHNQLTDYTHQLKSAIQTIAPQIPKNTADLLLATLENAIKDNK